MGKRCGKCQKVKVLSLFNKKSVSKDGYGNTCKECNKENLREHYLKNKVYYKEKRQRYQKSIKSWLIEYKSKLECKNCGESRWWVLDFHHVDPKQKEYNLANLAKDKGKKAFLKEVKKCDVLCSNCHRDLHHRLRKEG
jgi:hypothetical protein